jgi:hypothetical protein
MFWEFGSDAVLNYSQFFEWKHTFANELQAAEVAPPYFAYWSH